MIDRPPPALRLLGSCAAVAALCGLSESVAGVVPGLTAGLLVAWLLDEDAISVPCMLAAGLAGMIAVGALAGTPLTVACAATARAVETLLTLELLRWYARGPFRLADGRAAAAFLVVAAAAPAAGAVTAATLARMSGVMSPAVSQWWYGDMAGIVGAGMACAVRELRRVRCQLAREHHEARAAQGAILGELQRVLTGLRAAHRVLPLCGHCGEFRDDAAYWTTLDTYRSTHGAALADADVCPDCTVETGGAVDWNEVFGLRRA